MSLTMPRIVECPSCGRPVPWTESSRWRPFCSERCRLIDLGAWASERYGIPTEAEESEEPSEPAQKQDDSRGDGA